MNDFVHQIGNGGVLRILQESDADAAFAATERDRAHLRPWLPWVDRVLTVDQTRQFIRFRLREHEQNNGFLAGIFLDNTFVGGAGFHGFDRHNHTTDIGYWLAPMVQGRGLASKSVAAMLDYAFNQQNINRVEIRSDVANTRSGKLAERLGFQLEGILRQAGWIDGRFVDHALYALLARDWRGRR